MFRIAETLGCFVSDIEERMAPDELVEWAAWFTLQAEERKKAAGNQPRRRR